MTALSSAKKPAIYSIRRRNKSSNCRMYMRAGSYIGHTLSGYEVSPYQNSADGMVAIIKISASPCCFII